MDSPQALPLPPQPTELTLSMIAPTQVWASLTLSQRNGLLQAVARICQEALLPASTPREANHE